MSISPRARRRGAAAAVLAAVVSTGLAGCGTGVTPGAAVRVGEESISSRAVAEAARDICTLSEEQLTSVIPMSVMRTRAIELLTLGAVGRQVAEEYSVELGESYEEQVAGLEAAAAPFPASARDTFIELSEAIAFSNAVRREAGRLSLVEEGVAEPSIEDQDARGGDIFVRWQDENEVTVNPRYGVAVVDGAVVAVPTDTSVAVSDVALAGQAEEVDVEAAATLPDAQRCG